MTDTPDLHTLADVFVRAALDCGLSELPPGEQRKYLRGLAAVLPEHRRQVLAEVAEVPVEHPASADVIQRATIEVGAEQLRKAIRRLASAAPETAPSPRQNDETAPAVPEATPDTREANPYRLVMTPQGERVAYLPSWEDLPLGWVDLGPYPTDPKAGDDGR